MRSSSPTRTAEKRTTNDDEEAEIEGAGPESGNVLTTDDTTPTKEKHTDLPSDSDSALAPLKPGLFSPQGQLRPFRLLISDLRGRPKYFKSDWTTFNQLVLASAVFVFFTNLLPGITFASDLYQLTGRNYGAIEVILSTAVCGLVFSIFSGQPLTILGVTGPFCILAERLYEMHENSFPKEVDYLAFMAWSCIHSMWMLILLAIFNAHDWTMKYVTIFSTEIFSLLNSIIYFHKAILELERVRASSDLATFLYAIISCIGTFLLAVVLSTATSKHWRILHRYIRMGLSEYAATISIILFIALPHLGELKSLDHPRLSVSETFRPTLETRSTFLVKFWELPSVWVVAAMLPGLIITTLFFFDVEVSTICATLPRYNLRKPGGYAWDVLLLGLTTGLCGILGIPPANGLLPQAPLHSESLLHKEKRIKEDRTEEVVETVYEQRWSHFLHAVGIACFLSPPFMKVLGLTPTSVLAGLFLFMGQQSLWTNPILFRTLDLITPKENLTPLPSSITSRAPIHGYTIFQILVTVGIFIITLTPAAPGFPVVIIAFVPFRLLVMNRIWSEEVLSYVDGWACRPGEEIRISR